MPRTDRQAKSQLRFGKHVSDALGESPDHREAERLAKRIGESATQVRETLLAIKAAVAEKDLVLPDWSGHRAKLVEVTKGLRELVYHLQEVPAGLPQHNAIASAPVIAAVAMLKALPSIPELRSAAPLYKKFLVEFQKREAKLAAANQRRKEADAAHDEALLDMAEALAQAGWHLKRLPRDSPARKHYEKWWARRKKKDADTKTETETE